MLEEVSWDLYVKACKMNYYKAGHRDSQKFLTYCNEPGKFDKDNYFTPRIYIKNEKRGDGKYAFTILPMLSKYEGPHGHVLACWYKIYDAILKTVAEGNFMQKCYKANKEKNEIKEVEFKEFCDNNSIYYLDVVKEYRRFYKYQHDYYITPVVRIGLDTAEIIDKIGNVHGMARETRTITENGKVLMHLYNNNRSKINDDEICSYSAQGEAMVIIHKQDPKYRIGPIDEDKDIYLA